MSGYDGQGKSQADEVHGAMVTAVVLVGAALMGFLIFLAAIAGLVFLG